MGGGHRDVELVFFSGCPNVGAARANLRAALKRVGQPVEWLEWDLDDSATPSRAIGYGSPAVLVDGRDVAGVRPNRARGARSCRLGGPPTVAQIADALTNARRTKGPDHG